MHAEIGNPGNTPTSESFYDRMRREWAKRFSTVDPVQAAQAVVAFAAQKKREIRRLQI